MTYGVASDLLLGALGLVNLVLLLGVVRRLNEHTRVLAQTLAAADPVPVMLTGNTVGDFAVSTVDGELVDRAGLDSFTLVGFVSTGCPACAESLPAFLDRAGRFRTFWYVILPQVRGGIAVTVIFVFLNAWNEFLFAVLLGGKRVQTVTVHMFNYVGIEQTQWAMLSAAGIIAMIPVIVIGLASDPVTVAGAVTTGARSRLATMISVPAEPDRVFAATKVTA